jgi:Fur family peroxide stress response transcriptional regulator
MKKYRDIGFKLTPQRLAILNYLEGNKEHPSAEDIYQAVLKKFPTISFATVYTTLAALKEKGKLLELTSNPNKKHYDPETSDHSHLLCVSCKRIFDIPVEYTLVLPESVSQNFTITKSHMEFHGLCPECKKSGTEKTSGKTTRNVSSHKGRKRNKPADVSR